MNTQEIVASNYLWKGNGESGFTEGIYVLLVISVLLPLTCRDVSYIYRSTLENPLFSSCAFYPCEPAYRQARKPVLQKDCRVLVGDPQKNFLYY